MSRRILFPGERRRERGGKMGPEKAPLPWNNENTIIPDYPTCDDKENYDSFSEVLMVSLRSSYNLEPSKHNTSGTI